MTYHRPTTHAVARDGRIERRYEMCSCGRYWKDPWQYVCLRCEDESEDRQARSVMASRPHLTLIYSPDPTWTKGGLWYMCDLKDTLEAGHMTEGTVFEGSQQGRRYVVVGSKPQRLEEQDA